MFGYDNSLLMSWMNEDVIKQAFLSSFPEIIKKFGV